MNYWKRFWVVMLGLFFVLFCSSAYAATEKQKQEMKKYFNAGQKFYEQGDYGKAIGEWERILKIDPSHSVSKEKIKKAKSMLLKQGREKSVKGGTLFKFKAPEAKIVYLAGSFNNWADNSSGVVSDSKFAMSDDDKDGVWEKVVVLAPGEHKFKYVVDGTAWSHDPSIPEKDSDENSIIRISAAAVSVGGDIASPKKVKGGTLFKFKSPEAKVVYLAGSFNNWADNDSGAVSDSKFAMSDDDKDGVWEKVVVLAPGEHKFKYVVDGTAWSPDPSIAEKDSDENSIIRISKEVSAGISKGAGGVAAPKKVKGDVLFQFSAPDAGIVYLAGDFNNWADNSSGVVSDSKFAMSDDDKDGIWEKRVPLGPGTYKFKYVVDGNTWSSDPSIAEKDGDENSVLIIK